MKMGFILSELPKSCYECGYHEFDYDYGKCYCHAGSIKTSMAVGEHSKTRSPYCPIHPLPEKIDAKEGAYKSPLECFDYGMKTGWNDCLDAILKEAEEE